MAGENPDTVAAEELPKLIEFKSQTQDLVDRRRIEVKFFRRPSSIQNTLKRNSSLSPSPYSSQASLTVQSRPVTTDWSIYGIPDVDLDRRLPLVGVKFCVCDSRRLKAQGTLLGQVRFNIVAVRSTTL